MNTVSPEEEKAVCLHSINYFANISLMRDKKVFMFCEKKKTAKTNGSNLMPTLTEMCLFLLTYEVFFFIARDHDFRSQLE